MVVDLSKVILATGYNSFKNDSSIYTGSINFPTSLTAGQLSITTTSVSLSSLPQFSKFFAFFQEFNDAFYSVNPAAWYPNSVGGQQSIAIRVTAPAGNVGWLTCAVYPVILTNTVLVTAVVNNPYSNSITLQALNVPFAFLEYTLAN